MQQIVDFVLWTKTEMPVVHEYGVCIKVLTVDADALSGFLGIVIAMVPSIECRLIPMIEIIGQGCFAV